MKGLQTMNYTQMTTETILANLNALVDEWRDQFDNPPEASPVSFSITDSGRLFKIRFLIIVCIPIPESSRSSPANTQKRICWMT